MKNFKFLFLILCNFLFAFTGNSQSTITPASPGFDISMGSISHGKIDTVIYRSETVGTNRRALIYPPPGFSKEKK